MFWVTKTDAKSTELENIFLDSNKKKISVELERNNVNYVGRLGKRRTKTRTTVVSQRTVVEKDLQNSAKLESTNIFVDEDYL